MAVRAPKQWCLSRNETVTSYESWKQNLLYILALDSQFAPFLVDGVQWERKTRSSPLRGFTDDPSSVPQQQRRTAQQKVNMLELMLGQIANFCPIIARNTIVKNSTSMPEIWQAIRLHFGFQTSGANFIDFTAIHLEPGERHEDLYQRLMAFVDDSLLRRDSGISHNGLVPADDEELTPTLENMIVLTWLNLIHAALPKLVKQRYGTELRSRTLASIRPEISQALDSLLQELNAAEHAQAFRTAVATPTNKFSNRFPSTQLQPKWKTPTQPKRARCCPLCQQAGRPSSHYLSKCQYLPPEDKAYMAKARQIMGSTPDDESEDEESQVSSPIPVQRVQIGQSPYLDSFYSYHPVRITIDSGATGNMIRASLAQSLGIHVAKTSQSAHQADGSSPLTILGETRFELSRDGHQLLFEGLVVKNLDTALLAGIPFMERNDISIRPAKREIVIAGHSTYSYGSQDPSTARHAIRRTHVLHDHNNMAWRIC